MSFAKRISKTSTGQKQREQIKRRQKLFAESTNDDWIPNKLRQRRVQIEQLEEDFWLGLDQSLQQLLVNSLHYLEQTTDGSLRGFVLWLQEPIVEPESAVIVRELQPIHPRTAVAAVKVAPALLAGSTQFERPLSQLALASAHQITASRAPS